MENIDYSSYIFAAYAVALVSIFVVLFKTFKRHRQLKRELAKAKPKKRS
jgi:heme exporter protein CcmD